jgi:general secretion pathway protein L
MSLADVLTPPLSRLKARYAASPLPRFFAWWLGELRGLLPARWRERLVVREAELWLHLDDDSLQVCRAVEGRSQELLRLPLAPASDLVLRFEQAIGDELAGLRRVLLLSPAQVLRRRLSLPAVARDKLRTMIGFELDRQTPFRAEQVYFDTLLLPHAGDARQLPVELALVQRDVLEQGLTQLGPLAAALDAVDVREGEGRLGANLLPLERRRRRDLRRLWVNLGLVAGSLLLLLIAMAQLVDNRRQAVEQLQEELDRQRVAARGVGQLRSQLDDAVAAANFLAVAKASQPSMLELLTALTDLLPDDTHLERLTVGGDGNLHMTGQSNQAAQLIERLQGSPLIRNPALAGSIQPDARSGKDRFNITAQVASTAEVTP